MRPSRPKWLTDLLDYLLDNLFDILTIAASAYVIIRNEFIPYGANDIAVLATWILGILGLLAVSGLWQRNRQLRNIQEVGLRTNELVTHKLSGQVNAKDFFWPGERKVTSQDIANADDIYIVGMILNRAVRNNLAIFGDRTAVGANIRFVLLDPDDESMMTTMPYRSYGTKTSAWWRERIHETVGRIEDIPNIDKPKGSIMVGFLPFFPSFGMWLIDPEKPHGRIVVEIYHHRTAEPNPTFLLKASEDPHWYSFFKNQFDLMWKSCEENGKVVDIITPEAPT
jgi:hypothetical protein